MTDSAKNYETLSLTAPSNLVRTVEAVCTVAGVSKDQFILECLKDGVLAMVQDPDYQQKRARIAHHQHIEQYAPVDEAAAERVRSIDVSRESPWFKALQKERIRQQSLTDESM